MTAWKKAAEERGMTVHMCSRMASVTIFSAIPEKIGNSIPGRGNRKRKGPEGGS
jgi:hypothetical protein